MERPISARAGGGKVTAMASNGRRSPQRPQIQHVAGGASVEEAAAIAVALERFLADTSPPPRAEPVSRWLRAALREGVEARQSFPL